MITTRKQAALVAGVLSAAIVVPAGTAVAGYGPADPNPLRARPVLRIGDVSARANIVAVGYREGDNPGRLYVTWSKDGGVSYRKSNGNTRRFRVAGVGKLGISMDICSDTIWIASAANFPGDRAEDSDVLVRPRFIDGGDAQAFITSPSRDRKVGSVDITCVGGDHIAVAWVERLKGTTRARLIIQSQDSFQPATFKKTFVLGKAVLQGGISVAGTPNGVSVAWVKGRDRNVKLQHFEVGDGDTPAITKRPLQEIGTKDALWPQLAARNDLVVAAYTDRGKVKVKVSDDAARTWSRFEKIVPIGTKSKASRANSIDVSGDRIVVTAMIKDRRSRSPARIESSDFGATWTTATFGHKGPRKGSLQRTGDSTSLLKEAWHHNGRSQDKIRAQYED